MKTKLRTIRVDDTVYKWHVGPTNDDYPMRKLRVWRGKKVVIDLWLRDEYLPVTPKFVAEQIGYLTKPVEFVRAAGACVCQICGKQYLDHPFGGPFISDAYWDTHQWLHRLCNGELVKL